MGNTSCAFALVFLVLLAVFAEPGSWQLIGGPIFVAPPMDYGAAYSELVWKACSTAMVVPVAGVAFVVAKRLFEKEWWPLISLATRWLMLLVSLFSILIFFASVDHLAFVEHWWSIVLAVLIWSVFITLWFVCAQQSNQQESVV